MRKKVVSLAIGCYKTKQLIEHEPIRASVFTVNRAMFIVKLKSRIFFLTDGYSLFCRSIKHTAYFHLYAQK